ncbi:amidohydrolase family protein [Janibacter corallicola]|uniref:amidohydrolase family protein n=1 Tax=Janibacter corallicola TaxID=415212 RepID=UPI000833A7AC|nr:amidohydrolase family protein [Janibacter corallicola]
MHTPILPPDEAARVRERWERLGLPGIIDVHVHFMPQRVMDKVWAYFDAAGPKLGRSWPIAYRMSEHERLSRLREMGVLFFPSLNYPHKPEMAEWLNQWSAKFADETPEVLRSATFHPEPGAGAYVRAAIEDGARIVKAHVQVGDYDPNDPLLDEVWAQLAVAGTPVVLHAGHGPAPGTHTGPEGVRRLLQRFPELTLVIAHLGMPDYGAFLDLCAEYPNVHLDTTMAFTGFTEESWPFPEERREDLRALGEKILFGSDFPNIPYSYLEAVDAVLDLGLGADWERGVLHDNAARLFGVRANPTQPLLR